MAEPLPLYRSISIPELLSVVRDGAITGGQNRFNLFDPRRLVFFGDALTDWLIGQGEATYRQAFYAAQFSSVYQDCLQVGEEIGRLSSAILSEMNADGIPHDPEAAELFPFGGHGKLKREALKCRVTRTKYRDAFQCLNRLGLLETKLSEQHCALVAALELQAEAAKRAQPFTSAVLITYPVSGGWRYDTLPHQGGSEYGFLPGHVLMNQVREVVMIKDRKIVGRCSLQAATTFVCEQRRSNTTD